MPSLYIITGSNGAGKSTIGLDYLPEDIRSNYTVFDGDLLFVKKQRDLFPDITRSPKEAKRLAFYVPAGSSVGDPAFEISTIRIAGSSPRDPAGTKKIRVFTRVDNISLLTLFSEYEHYYSNCRWLTC